MNKISIVINTLNEEKNIERVMESVKWADEIVMVDDGSTDRTLKVVEALRQAQGINIKIFKHKGKGYVEPARNFAISKASRDWILILDADEEIPESLGKRLQDIATKMHQIDYVEIPRKNIIFGKWMKASMWWPDYNIRFFKKGKVLWSEKIHSNPKTEGEGIKLEEEERWAIVHYNYQSITQFIERMNRYTSIQAKELEKDGVKFTWSDLINKPLGEFLSRFFANKGYEDGLHGLAASLLQAFSYLVMYLKVWEKEKFKYQEINLEEIKEISRKSGQEINYWIKGTRKNPFKRFFQKIKT